MESAVCNFASFPLILLICPTENAVIVAQTEGKTVELCQSNGTFLNDYNSCKVCIQTFKPNTTITDYSSLSADLSPFIDYCEETNATSPVTGVVTFTFTATQSSRVFTVTVTTLLGTGTTSTTQGIQITAIESAATVSSGNSVSTNQPSVITGIRSVTAVASESALAPPAQAKLNTWIAGPVVGAVAGVVVVITVVYVWRRRKGLRSARSPNDFFDKPQLHSDHIPRPQPPELEAKERQEPVELPTAANEAVFPPFEMDDNTDRLEHHTDKRSELEQPPPESRDLPVRRSQ